jgi:tripartite-type tricarboxylate transporter receptor subunit TctC
MPGAGSLVAANYIANLAPKDGTEIGSVETFIPFEAYYKGPGVRFDPLKLSWLGALNAEMTTCVVWHESKVQTFSDLLLTDVPFGATGSGAPPVVEPKIMNSVLGTRIKLVTGYQGMADIFVAMENREVDGSCGINWSTLTATHADWLAQQKIRLIVQNAFDRHPDVKHVPLLLDFAKTEKQKGVLTLLAAPNRVGRPYMAPPGISHERLAVLRKALDDTVRDPQFLAEAARLKLSVNAVSGEDVHGVFQAAAKVDQSMVNEMISARGN